MKNMGDGRRKERVEKEVQQIISSYMISHLQGELGGLVTVTKVMMPADFRSAKVFVTFFSADDIKIDLLKVLQPWARDIQNQINAKLQMRYVPKITFYKDEATESILRVEKIISEISKNSPKSESTEEE